jgi:DNA repair protein RadC
MAEKTFESPSKKYPKLATLREFDVRLRPTNVKVPAASLRKISTANDAAHIFKALSDRLPVEAFYALHLDNKNRPIGIHELAKGAGNAVSVSPRDTFGPPLVTGAIGIIISHNHPSGDPTPSQDDRILTDRMKQAGKLLGIPVLDHIVVGDDAYYSLVNESKSQAVWDPQLSYSTGGWASAFAAVTSVVGLLAIVFFGARSVRGKAPTTAVAGLELLGAK